MKKENIHYLNRHIHHWHSLRNNACISNFSGETAKELLRITREEWDPQYSAVLHHPQNVCILITYAYTRFEHYLQQQATSDCDITIDEKTVDSRGMIVARKEDVAKSSPTIKLPNKKRSAPTRKTKARIVVSGSILPCQSANKPIITKARAQTGYCIIRPPPA